MRTLERIARKICERLGDDPDLMAYPPMQHQYAFGIQHVLIAPIADIYEPKPLWNWYLPMAEAAVRALQLEPPARDPGDWNYWLRNILNETEG